MVRFIADYNEEPEGATPDGRFSSPAFSRNHQPILTVVTRYLAGRCGHVLEIGSGPGQHISLIAKDFPDCTFWPSDPLPAHRKSVAAWCAYYGAGNVMAPVELDAAAEDWRLGAKGRPPVGGFRAILCINVFHIAPWAVARGILRGAGRHLADDGVLLIYGPFSIDGKHVSQSNAEFDTALRDNDPRWGVRDNIEIAADANAHGLVIGEIVEMPSNNFIFVVNRR